MIGRLRLMSLVRRSLTSRRVVGSRVARRAAWTWHDGLVCRLAWSLDPGTRCGSVPVPQRALCPGRIVLSLRRWAVWCAETSSWTALSCRVPCPAWRVRCAR